MTHPQLKRLKIHRYEEFVDVPWIEFSPHENVILGINGAGKTRLLRLISAVLNFNYTDLLAHDFDVEFELTFSSWSQDRTAIKMHGWVRSDDESPNPGVPRPEALGRGRQLIIKIGASDAEHRVTYDSDRTGSTLQFDGEPTTVARTPAAGAVIPWEHIDLSKNTRMAALWPIFIAFYAREDDRDFQSLTTGVHFQLRQDTRPRIPVISETGNLPPFFVATLVHLLAGLTTQKARERLVFDEGYSFPGAVDEGASGQFQPMLAALSAESMTLSPKIVHSNGDLLDCQGFEVNLKFTSGAEYTDNGLTFGQRRFLLMALLLLFRPSYPALIDEIDNGLHPRLVEAVLNLMSGRQSFLTSHNKLVIDYINYDSADDIRRKIHICRRDATGRQTVDALSETAAQEVYEKVAVGIMHPSDVLLNEGLW